METLKEKFRRVADIRTKLSFTNKDLEDLIEVTEAVYSFFYERGDAAIITSQLRHEIESYRSFQQARNHTMSDSSDFEDLQARKDKGIKRTRTVRNVHTEHCCKNCGCKYGDKDCPVVEGRLPQSFPCGNNCEW